MAFRQRLMTHATTYTCPECEETIDCRYDAEVCECESCATRFKIDHDYSFEDGAWRNCSTLIKL